MPEAERQRTAAAPDLADRYAATRRLSESLVAPLSEADATIQSMPDASPAKWHLAHTTWFFETFLLRDRLPGYRLHDERWPFLFNSYYEGEGERIARPRRGMLSRPTLTEIIGWRAHVDEAMQALLGDPRHTDLIELGVAHEQQHQELLLTDIKHALFQNPLGPAMWDAPAVAPRVSAGPEWHEHPGGIALVGHQGEGFAFDNEGPAHRVLLEPFALAGRLISNGDWERFIADGGYRTASLWLSDGWDWVRRQAIEAPIYWREAEQFTHAGWQPRDPKRRYATCRTTRPTPSRPGPARGCRQSSNGKRSGRVTIPPRATSSTAPRRRCRRAAKGCSAIAGSSPARATLPHPRFAPAAGAVGEYNGKFMAGQWVLKGASCATVRGHSRASYRNFFYPQQRWQFTGLRLAKDR